MFKVFCSCLCFQYMTRPSVNLFYILDGDIFHLRTYSTVCMNMRENLINFTVHVYDMQQTLSRLMVI
jgi:hypothetical protein